MLPKTQDSQETCIYNVITYLRESRKKVSPSLASASPFLAKPDMTCFSSSGDRSVKLPFAVEISAMPSLPDTQNSTKIFEPMSVEERLLKGVSKALKRQRLNLYP